MTASARYLCIHGHFYQPPRENPWLEAVEMQDSAFPYHDWNARIAAECYAPNAVSRILDAEGKIVQLVNNYSKISFNFGPTLLRWMESEAPTVYRAVLDADRLSQDAFGGHGSALAQPYHHSILPLCSRRDKETEIRWGLADFEHRFQRQAEGMWLPETAVDVETLDILASHGIRFTILSPGQAARIRRDGERQWQDVAAGGINPRRVYRAQLPSGRSISLFFYDGLISKAVAFERLLNRGEDFAHRLLGAFSGDPEPQLVHIATDGETYGHHHRHGEMALSYALDYLQTNQLVRLTNYGAYLAGHPPQYQVEILENTSWSCAHGVERWRSDCGCQTGGRPGWNQAWRRPLREALDWLRDETASLYAVEGSKLLRNPWAARDAYVQLILSRNRPTLDRFLSQQAKRSPAPEERVRTLKLLELQRHALLMYTSCGWFFNDLSGIETRQVLRYAGRAIQLAEELFQTDLESPFTSRLARARSNLAAHGDGARIYRKTVKPARVGLQEVGAHYAISSLFEPYGEQASIYCYSLGREDHRLEKTGRASLVVGRLRVTSEITLESALLTYAVLHLGDHNLNAAVRPFENLDGDRRISGDLRSAFVRGDLTRTLRVLNRHFGRQTYSLKSLFRDQQRKVLGRILESTVRDLENQYRRLYEQQASLIHFVADSQTPLPLVFRTTASLVLQALIRSALEEDPPNFGRVKDIFSEAARIKIDLDTEALTYSFTLALQRMTRGLQDDPTDLPSLRRLREATELCLGLPCRIDLWGIQNLYFEVLSGCYPAQQEKQDPESRSWITEFLRLGKTIQVRVRE